MSKEWILNAATGRFQLNFKRNVGAAADEIRKCEPQTLEDWQSYYFASVYPLEHLEELGRKLYVKVTEVVQAEVESITEQDCIDYIRDLVIERTFAGYITEKTMIYGQLQKLLDAPIAPAPDEWDRRYNVDFSIAVGTFYIGLQIKPMSFYNANEFYKWREVQAKPHAKFEKKFGGAVFTSFRSKRARTKPSPTPKSWRKSKAKSSVYAL